MSVRQIRMEEFAMRCELNILSLRRGGYNTIEMFIIVNFGYRKSQLYEWLDLSQSLKQLEVTCFTNK